MSYAVGLVILVALTLALVGSLLLVDPVNREILRVVVMVLAIWLLFLAITTTPHIAR